MAPPEAAPACPPRVAILIPVYNEEADVGRTITALLGQTLRPAEIVIADGGSTDDTMRRVRALDMDGVRLRTVENPKRFPGAGRNAAAEAAQCEFVACMDAGNVADSDWLAELVAPVQRDGTIDAVFGCFLPSPETPFERVASAVAYAGQGNPGDVRPVRVEADMPLPFSGSSVLVRKSAYDAVGGFADWLRAAEDKLFGVKLLRAGRAVVFTPHAVVRHHVRPNLAAFFRQYLTYGRWNALSGQLPEGIGWLALKYLLGLVLLGAAVRAPILLVLLVAGMLRHTYRWAYRPYVRLYGAPPPGAMCLLLPLALTAREVGGLLGLVSGRWQRFRNPRYDALLAAYLAGTEA